MSKADKKIIDEKIIDSLTETKERLVDSIIETNKTITKKNNIGKYILIFIIFVFILILGLEFIELKEFEYKIDFINNLQDEDDEYVTNVLDLISQNENSILTIAKSLKNIVIIGVISGIVSGIVSVIISCFRKKK